MSLMQTLRAKFEKKRASETLKSVKSKLDKKRASKKEDVPKKSAKREKEGRRSFRVNLLALSVVPFIGVFFITVALLVLFLGDAEQTLQNEKIAIEALALDTLSGQFSMAINQRKQWIKQLSLDPDVVEVFARGPAARQRIQDRLTLLLGDAMRVRLLDVGFSERRTEESPPIGIGVIDMVARAEKGNLAPAIEVHFPGGASEHINFLQPVVKLDGTLVGHILVSFRATLFHDLIENYHIPVGYASLIYIDPDGNPSELAGKGDRTLKKAICRQPAKIAGTPLGICYFTDKNSGVITSSTMEKQAVLFVVYGVMLLVLCLIPMLIARWLIRLDGRTFIQIIEEMQQSEIRSSYPARTNELAVFLRRLHEISLDFIPPPPGTSVKERAKRAEAQQPKRAAGEPSPFKEKLSDAMKDEGEEQVWPVRETPPTESGGETLNPFGEALGESPDKPDSLDEAQHIAEFEPNLYQKDKLDLESKEESEENEESGFFFETLSEDENAEIGSDASETGGEAFFSDLEQSDLESNREMAFETLGEIELEAKTENDADLESELELELDSHEEPDHPNSPFNTPSETESETTSEFTLPEDIDLDDLPMLEIQDILRGLSLAPDKSAPAKPKEEPKAPAVPVIPKPKRVTAPPLPLPAEIFRAYDIRGIVDQSLSDETVGLIAQAIGTEAVSLGHHAIIVCRDGRLSGPRLLNILIDGLKSTGLSVINIGAVPTPVMYFSTYALGTRAGVALTGSHNPKDYNGLKITLGGKSIAGEGIQKIRRIAESRNFAIGNGKVREQNMIPEYLDRIIEDVTLMRPMKIVVDCGNGVAAAVAPKLFQALGCTVEVYGGEIDGNFPNHHPDPSVPANYEALINLVKIHQADLGIAFDGDGDRLGVVDSEGRIIWPDRLMMLFAQDVLSRNPGKEIIYDVKCTQRLSKVISEYGGIPVMWKTGHSWIKNKMQELDAPLAGEMSGHIFFSERWYGFDDALYAASRLLEILSADDRTSTEIFDELPDGISTPELKTDLKEGEPHKMIEEFLTRARFPAAKITSIDGLRADYVDGWGLARASNTTPSLVFRFDADNEAALSRIQQEFRRQILAINPKLKLPF